MDISATIVPKSDQINADDLVTGPLTITVTRVKPGSPEQPVIVHYDGDNGRPYKPCKSMRRLLAQAWGVDARAWAGRGMTLHHDPAVMFGGIRVGGIRISHLSHIESDMEVPLTMTKGKRALYRVRVLRRRPASPSLETDLSPVASGAAEGDDSAAGAVLDVAAVEAPPVDLPAPLPGADTIVERMEDAGVPPRLRQSVLNGLKALADAPDVWAFIDAPAWHKLVAALDDYPQVKAALTEAAKAKMEAK